jgi:hypothetical protein
MVVAAIVFLLSIAGTINHIVVVREAVGSVPEIDGWSVFARSAILLLAEGVSAGATLFFITRGSVLAAYNSSGVFLAIMLFALLIIGGRIMEAPAWQLSLSGGWLVFLVWLLWRVAPNTSLNRNATRDREG